MTKCLSVELLLVIKLQKYNFMTHKCFDRIHFNKRFTLQNRMLLTPYTIQLKFLKINPLIYNIRVSTAHTWRKQFSLYSTRMVPPGVMPSVDMASITTGTY